jgi:hypothetical protein
MHWLAEALRLHMHWSAQGRQLTHVLVGQGGTTYTCVGQLRVVNQHMQWSAQGRQPTHALVGQGETTHTCIGQPMMDN